MVLTKFDPEEFARVAEYLTEGNPTEGQIRTAVGRIYYSLFLIPYYHFYTGGRPPKRLVKQPHKNRSGLHAIVIDEVKRNFGSALGYQLQELMRLGSF